MRPTDLSDAPPTLALQRFPSALIDRLSLLDGREVVIRPILAFDARAEQDFVRALSAASRSRRFHVGLRELPPSLLNAMTRVDHDRHVAIVAEAIDEDDESTLVADARYVRGPDPAQAEFAIAVADAWQGVGLGRALMQRLGRHAARHGVKRLAGDVLSNNAPMLSLSHWLGGQFAPSPDGPGVVRVQFDL